MEDKPAGEAIFANQFCFNISKKPAPPLSSRSGSATYKGQRVGSRYDDAL